MDIKEPTNRELELMLKYMQVSLDSLHDKADYTNGQVLRNTEYRLKQQGTISTFKWLFGFLGLGNVVLLASLFTDILK